MPWEEFAFGMTATVFIAAIVTGMIAIVIRLTRKGTTDPEDVQQALATMEQRSAQLAAGLERLADLDQRVIELEERVDFAERLLAQERAREFPRQGDR